MCQIILPDPVVSRQKNRTLDLPMNNQPSDVRENQALQMESLAVVRINSYGLVAWSSSHRSKQPDTDTRKPVFISRMLRPGPNLPKRG